MSGDPILTGANPLENPVSLFLVQCLVIIFMSRLLAVPFSYLRQPRVIAEVVGGIILGNSALSGIPAFKNNVFPDTPENPSMHILSVVANFGLILYLFIVGLEMDLSEFVKNYKRSAAISLAGIFLPAALGAAASFLIWNSLMVVDGAVPEKPFYLFSIFLALAMSITAVPVLARILTENKLLKTPLGQTTLAAATVDDVVAWTLLILVVSLIKNSSNALLALWCFLSVVAWGLFLYFLVRPILIKWVALRSDSDQISQTSVFIVFSIVFISAFMTESLGVHAIFGAFLTGLIMPHEFGFAIKLTEKIEDLVNIVLLPLYFAFSGLKTRIDQLNDGTSWGIVFLVFLVACGGKIIGCGVAAKLNGLKPREALTVGVLMNTKGLVELIVLNLGLQNGVINQKVFTVMVVMALLTTFMTVPLVSWIYPSKLYLKKKSKMSRLRSPSKISIKEPLMEQSDEVKVLLCLPNMHCLPSMMALTQVIQSTPAEMSLHALRLIALGERDSTIMMATDSELTMRADPALNVFKTFGELNRIGVSPMLSVSHFEDFAENIVSSADEIGANLIIIPWNPHSRTAEPLEEHHQGLVQRMDNAHRHQLLDYLFDNSACTVVILVDRGFNIGQHVQANQMTTRSTRSALIQAATKDPQQVYVVFRGGPDDREALLFALYLTHFDGIKVTCLHLQGPRSRAPSIEEIHQTSTETVVTPTSGADEDENLLSSLRKDNAKIEFEEKPVENAVSQAIAYFKSKNVHHNDLVIVGKALYDKGVNEFIDTECRSSACVIQRSKINKAISP